MPSMGGYTATDLEPLIRGLVHRWVNREGLPLLDYQVHRLSDSLSAAILEKYAFPRVDPFNGVPHQRRPRVPGG